MEASRRDKWLVRYIRMLINDRSLTWDNRYRLIYDYKSYRDSATHLSSYFPGVDKDDVAKEYVMRCLEQAKGNAE